jgi:D-alanine-D-alanine ligase
MKRIVILYGGKSGEHEVSLVSAASIVRHIDYTRFEAILVGITKEGQWFLQDESVAARARSPEGAAAGSGLSISAGRRVFVAPGRGLVAEAASGLAAENKRVGSGGPVGVAELACDLVFPVLHGSFGEDGTIQGLLEVAGLPCVGASVMGSAIGMDKEVAKELWLRAGLPVVPFLAARAASLGDIDALARKVDARFGWPCFVKPACAGSSVGASKVADSGALEAALRSALEWDEKALIEPFVDAREIECAVLGNEDPVAFAPGEVVPSHEFYDYDAKYLDPEGARLDVPADIPAERAERVKSLAVAAFKAVELAGMARVDFFIDKKTGEVLLNEVNTIPGFTHISMYPRMCEAGGVAYSELITKLAELAMERFAKRARLRFMAAPKT